MKINKFFILIIFPLILFYPVSTMGQQVGKTTQIKTTPQRAAEGQTKWMISQFKLDHSLYKVIYDINLRYQLKADSVHTLNRVVTAKRELYFQYSQNRDEEFKKVLPAEAYDAYQNKLTTIKTRPAGK